MQNNLINLKPASSEPLSVEPRIVFFSGGSALKKTSQLISTISKNSVHIITTFDSGGSSGFLRQAFSIPAVGDLRNRILALADLSTTPNSMINFMNFRISDDSGTDLQQNQFVSFCKRDNEAWYRLPSDIYREFGDLIDYILPLIPPQFNFANLCIGNLLIVSHYLANGRDLEKTVDFFSHLFKTNGIVLPVSEENLHIASKLTRNSYVLGQHKLKNFGKYIKDIFLTPSEPEYGKAESDKCSSNYELKQIVPHINSNIQSKIHNADIICYPMGSFFSSVVVNMIPSGMAESICNTNCKKVFIPNTGYDPELDKKTIADQVGIIYKTLTSHVSEIPLTQLVSTIIVDLKNGEYNFASNNELEELAKLGIEIIDTDICANSERNKHNAENIIKQLSLLTNIK